MDKKKAIIAAIVALALLVVGFSIGYSRRKVEIKEVEKTHIEVVYKDKIVEVEKKVYVKVKAKDVVITKHEEKKADGTVVTDTTITDKTKDTNTGSSDTTKTEDKQQVVVQTVEKITEIKTLMLPDWFIYGGVGLDIRSPRLGEFPTSGIFAVTVTRRILFACYSGLQAQTDPLFNHPVLLFQAGCGF